MKRRISSELHPCQAIGHINQLGKCDLLSDEPAGAVRALFFGLDFGGETNTFCTIEALCSAPSMG